MQANKEFIWAQAYRPKTIQECILPVSLKQTLQDFVDKKDIPNMVMIGKPGCGKTTIAHALATEIGADVLFINASDAGIDTIRDKVVQYCSTVSFDDNIKLVILDEADSSRFRNAFEILRPIIEQFSVNCRFIFTGNNMSNIPEAIVSRCVSFDFTIPKKETPKLASQLLKRLKFILDDQSVTYDEKVLVQLIMRHFPNNRKVINELQKFSSSGHIDEGILANLSDDSFNSLLMMVKEKRFTDARTWVSDNSDIDPVFFYKTIYETCTKKLEPSSIAELVLILAKYQYQSAFSVDQEINTTACIVEMMSELRFK